MVVVYNLGGRIDTTISRHTKVKGRAETLPLKMFIKSENLFCYLLNQLRNLTFILHRFLSEFPR